MAPMERRARLGAGRCRAMASSNSDLNWCSIVLLLLSLLTLGSGLLLETKDPEAGGLR